MGLMDQAKKLLNNEQTTDKILDKAEEMATKKFGAEKAGQIKKVRETVDKQLGDNNTGANNAQDTSKAPEEN